MNGIDAPGVSEPPLRVVGLGKVYAAGQVRALREVSFSVEAGEFLCIVGPSGVGKTTLLKCLAGLAAPSEGTVVFEGEPVTRPPERLAVVFQDYSRSLAPWMTVLDNVVLPLRRMKLDRAERTRRGRRALESVGLTHASERFPWQLSGGMQQRVAIARGLAYEPELLLMDEPFASVDAQTREELEDLTRRLRDNYRITVLLVTHDIDEAVYLADRIVVLAGPPATVADIVTVGLPEQRDQITTRSLPAFLELRAYVRGLIGSSRPETGRATERHTDQLLNEFG